MSNTNIDDLDEEFEKWNPMKEAYFDSRFNLYDSGPGAALDKALQPAELAKAQNGLRSVSENEHKVDPYLVIKNLPKHMTVKSIKNICDRFGNVKDINSAPKQNAVFVKFYHIADMESVYRALNQNQYGLKVLIGKNFLNQGKKDDIELWQHNGEGIIDRPPLSSGINMERRTIIPSGKNPPRPSLKNRNMLELDDENCAIPTNDPLRHILKENDDAHGLERAGYNMSKLQTNSDDEFVYRTGRAFRNMPSKLKNHLEEAHKKSNGTYDADLERYCNKTKILPTIHKCVVCQQPSDISCYRCNSEKYIYCGRKCQNEDWENHRKICGRNKDIENNLAQTKKRLSISSENSSDSPIKKDTHNHSRRSIELKKSPSSSSGSSHNESFTSKSFPKPDMPENNSLVAMTTVNKTNLVFIRSRSKEDNLKFFQTIGKIQVASKSLRKLQKLPKVGHAVIAQFQNSNEYGRALVLNVDDQENIKVNYLDYGSTETKKFSDLYKVPRDFNELPRFAVPVLLKDVPNYYMTNEVRSFMYSYLRDMDLVVKYDEEQDLIQLNNVYQVDLYDALTNQHLNKTIAALCKPQEPKNVEELLTVEDLEINPLPVEKDIEYYVMDNTQLHVGCISCTTEDFLVEIEKFAEDIQLYAESLKPQSYAPREQELCIVKYSLDGRWYRGQCIEKVGDGNPTILYIDFGNIAFVKVSDIRPYPSKFNWPIYTVVFGIEGLPEEVNEKQVQRLEKLLPCGEPIRVDHLEKVSDNFYNATLNDVIKKLKDENLLN